MPPNVLVDPQRGSKTWKDAVESVFAMLRDHNPFWLAVGEIKPSASETRMCV